GWAISKQIVRSATSIGANYRAVCLAKSKADFINKLKIVEEECDETIFWLEVIEEAGILTIDRLKNLKSESMELFAIFVSSLRTAKINFNANNR
ncbi:MAG: four helix bundle protein, partial [Saprospiraceae bacterium]